MSYFDAGVGKRPIEQADVKDMQAGSQAEATAYFAARLGPPPRSPDSQAQPVEAPAQRDAGAHTLTRSPAHSLTQCPLCHSALKHHDGLYRCLGRCGARWLEDSPGRLVDL